MSDMFFLPYRPVYDTSTKVVPGAQVYFTLTGTNTPSAPFSDAAMTTPLANPVVANGVGRVPTTYLDSVVSYRVRVYSADAEVGVDTPLEEYDPYTPGEIIAEFDAPVYGDVSGLATVDSRALLAALPTTGVMAALSEAGREGLFKWDSSNLSTQVTADPNQGVYVAPTATPSGASGAWVRKFTGAHSVKWFGAVGDNATNDGPAFIAAIAYLNAISQTDYGNPYGIASPALWAPAARYFLNTSTLDITHQMIFEGDGGHVSGSGAATVLRWAAGTTGILIQSYNTSGSGGAAVAAHDRADGIIIRHMKLYGGYVATEGEYHGIQLRARATIDHVGIQNFAGDGIHASGSAGGGLEGNINCFRFDTVLAAGCRNGIFLDGADANAGMIIGCDLSSNRQWGIWDTSFLGNAVFGCHADANGLIPGAPPSVVSLSGNRYYLITGQAAGGATNSPSGTTASNTWWGYQGAGGPSAGNNIPTWANPTTVREGGAYHSDDSNNQTTWVGCYSETGQGPSQMAPGNLSLGHQFAGVEGGGYVRGGSGNYTRVASLYGEGLATFDDSVTLAGLLTANGGSHRLGNDGGDNSITMRHNATYNQFLLTNYAGTLEAALISATGSWVDLRGYPIIRLCSGPNAASNAIVGEVDINGLGVVLGSLGYRTGAGGAVTQITSRTTGVALNKACGAITLVSAAGSATWASFTVTNSLVAATDTIRVVQKSGADKNMIHVTAVGAGSFEVSFATTGGTTTEQPVFNFAIVKAVAA